MSWLYISIFLIFTQQTNQKQGANQAHHPTGHQQPKVVPLGHQQPKVVPLDHP
jgi:hypothetical protein